MGRAFKYHTAQGTDGSLVEGDEESGHDKGEVPFIFAGSYHDTRS